MRHQILADGRNQVARLVEVFMFFGFRGHVGYLTDVYEIFYVQLKLIVYISDTSIGMTFETTRWIAYLNESNALDFF